MQSSPTISAHDTAASQPTAGWRSVLLTELLAARREQAWGYRSAANVGSLAAEPTVWAAIALHAAGRENETVVGGALDWIAEQQRADGRVGVTEKLDQPAWTTALAVLAWNACGESHARRFESQSRAALQWLIQLRGQPIAPKAAGFAYDTQLIGWPWVAGTTSWLEPTAYSIMALRRFADSADTSIARVDEGVRLLLDRAVPTGGWNYGNPQAFGNGLRAFADTTGIALCALAGQPRNEKMTKAIEFLGVELPRVRAPLSLGWGLIGLRAWNAVPADAEGWLAEAAAGLEENERTPLHAALLLLAGAKDWSIYSRSVA